MEPSRLSQASLIRHSPRPFPQRGSLSGRRNNSRVWPRSKSRSRGRCRRFWGLALPYSGPPLPLPQEAAVCTTSQQLPQLNFSSQLSAALASAVGSYILLFCWSLGWFGDTSSCSAGLLTDWPPGERTYLGSTHEERARPQTNPPLLHRN